MMFQISAMKNFERRYNIKCSFPNYEQHLVKLENDIIHNPNCKFAKEYSLFIENITTTVEDQPLYQVNFPFYFYDFKDVKNGMIFDGFFQSEKYFAESRDVILKTFNVNLLNTEKYQDLNFDRTCSVHIRRGDYLKFEESHPVLNEDYYTNAIKIINDKIDNIIVFSDDLAWCKNNLISSKFNNKKLTFSSEDKDYLEMSLMSKCKFNIIANSSFSWWGAWLNNQEGKVVIAPRKWFGHNLEHLNTNDLIPESWIKI